MNYKEYVKVKFQSFHKENIFISKHALIRMLQRQIEPTEIIQNIINPERLEYAVKENAIGIGEEKFDCYFGYSKTQCHRYVLVIKENTIVVTAIKINRRWQRIVEAKLQRTHTKR